MNRRRFQCCCGPARCRFITSGHFTTPNRTGRMIDGSASRSGTSRRAYARRASTVTRQRSSGEPTASDISSSNQRHAVISRRTPFAITRTSPAGVHGCTAARRLQPTSEGDRRPPSETRRMAYGEAELRCRELAAEGVCTIAAKGRGETPRREWPPSSVARCRTPFDVSKSMTS